MKIRIGFIYALFCLAQLLSVSSNAFPVISSSNRKSHTHKDRFEEVLKYHRQELLELHPVIAFILRIENAEDSVQNVKSWNSDGRDRAKEWIRIHYDFLRRLDAQMLRSFLNLMSENPKRRPVVAREHCLQTRAFQSGKFDPSKELLAGYLGEERLASSRERKSLAGRLVLGNRSNNSISDQEYITLIKEKCLSRKEISEHFPLIPNDLIYLLDYEPSLADSILFDLNLLEQAEIENISAVSE